MTTEEEKKREESEQAMRDWASSINFVDEDGNPVRPPIVPDKMDLEEEESLEPEDQMTDEEYNETIDMEIVSLGEEEDEDEEDEDEEEEE